MKDFGDRLKELRQSRKMTQTQFGNIFKVSANTISSWKLDKQEPNLDTLLAISVYFDVSIDCLLAKSDY